MRHAACTRSLAVDNNQLTGNLPDGLASLTALTRLNVSYNQLGGTLPRLLNLTRLSPAASVFAGNCYPGYPPLGSCDGYYLSATGQSCGTTCTALGLGCSGNIQTDDSVALLQSLVLASQNVTCVADSR